jgi:aminoglycoside phosphotransferase (APT) family kinase protein
MAPDELVLKLAAAWRRRHREDVVVENLARLSAGASAQSWLFEAAGPRGREKLVLQLYAGGENFVAALSKTAQARVQSLAGTAGVRTPPVALVVGPDDGLPEGFASAYVAGETLGKRVVNEPGLAAARAALPEQCAQALGLIHGIDASGLDWLPVLGAEAQLEELARSHRACGESLPVFELALAWLAGHLPPTRVPRLVHGDFRTGNFIVDANGLAAVLDWELAHLGDPMEDLGWLCVGSWRFGRDELAVGGFGQRAPFYAAYARYAGETPNPAAIHFWEVFGTLKWGVICQWFAHRFLAGAANSLEPAVIGRRVSEVELQLLELLDGHGY